MKRLTVLLMCALMVFSTIFAIAVTGDTTQIFSNENTAVGSLAEDLSQEELSNNELFQVADKNLSVMAQTSVNSTGEKKILKITTAIL